MNVIFLGKNCKAMQIILEIKKGVAQLLSQLMDFNENLTCVKQVIKKRERIIVSD